MKIFIEKEAPNGNNINKNTSPKENWQVNINKINFFLTDQLFSTATENKHLFLP